MKQAIAECVLCFVVLPGLALWSILMALVTVAQLIVRG
jgi:hypothetical protein